MTSRSPVPAPPLTTPHQTRHVTDCDRITDRGIQHIAKRCSDLRELCMFGLGGVGDPGVAAVAAHCAQLNVLDISYCKLVTDQGLKLVGSGCLRLATLTMICHRGGAVSEAGLDHIRANGPVTLNVVYPFGGNV